MPLEKRDTGDGRVVVTDKRYRLPKNHDPEVEAVWAKRFMDGYLDLTETIYQLTRPPKKKNGR